MTTEQPRDIFPQEDAEAQRSEPVEIYTNRKASLPTAQRTLAQSLDELVRPLGYRLVISRPLRFSEDSAAGILEGLGLSVDALDSFLTDLWLDVVSGAKAAQDAVETAHARIITEAEELGFGTKLKSRYFGIPVPLPASAELGRMCDLVSRMAERLASLNERSHVAGGRTAAIRIRLRQSE
jgi:hypothetical protein